MRAAIDFYFDFVSPYSYLVSTVLPRLAAEHAAPINYQPFGLLDLMKIVGNRPIGLPAAPGRAVCPAPSPPAPLI